MKRPVTNVTKAIREVMHYEAAKANVTKAVLGKIHNEAAENKRYQGYSRGCFGMLYNMD